MSRRGRDWWTGRGCGCSPLACKRHPASEAMQHVSAKYFPSAEVILAWKEREHPMAVLRVQDSASDSDSIGFAPAKISLDCKFLRANKS